MFNKRLLGMLIPVCLLLNSFAASSFAKQDDNPTYKTVTVTGDDSNPHPSVYFAPGEPTGKEPDLRIWGAANSINHELYGSTKFRVFDTAFDEGLVVDENGVTAKTEIRVEGEDTIWGFKSDTSTTTDVFTLCRPDILNSSFFDFEIEEEGSAKFTVFETTGTNPGASATLSGTKLEISTLPFGPQKNVPTISLSNEGVEWDIINDGSCMNFSFGNFNGLDDVMVLDSFAGLRLQGTDPLLRMENEITGNLWLIQNEEIGHLTFGLNDSDNIISMLDTGGMQVKKGNKLVELLSGPAQNHLNLKSNSSVSMSLHNTAANANWIMSNDSTGRFVLTRAGSGVAEFSIKKNGDLFLNGTLFNSSDRNKKKAFQAVDATEVLNKVAAMPITTWQYKANDAGERHMGPMAQDFRAAFGLGESDKTLATVDGIGVSLAAIKGLNNKVEGLKKSNESLSQQLQQKDDRIDDLEDRLEQLMLRMESFESASTK